MAWPNPFRKTTSNTRTYRVPHPCFSIATDHIHVRSAWGYTFDLTDDHWAPEQAHSLKFSYDTLAEECLERLDEIHPPHRSELPRNSTLHKPSTEKEAAPPPRRDLYELLKDHADTHPKLKELWDEVNTVPAWVDWDQILRGQDVFYRYGGACLTGLAYQSLLGGMGAARVVETLARTGGFSTKVARGRLFETTQHILQCTRSLESIQPGGEGFASSIRVRLLHAAVRNRIMRLAKERPSYYNVEEWGVPINDLDSIATIGTFSATLIWLSLPRQGIYLREQEKVDYIALWRYIGYIMGCPTDRFESPAKAKATMEFLLLNEIKPTDMSQILANNIIKCLDCQPPGFASADMLIASARWLNGHELCDKLGLARPGLYYYALMAGQCAFFMTYCYITRAVPSWDAHKIKSLKRIFYAIVVESKYGLAGTTTVFDFKYVPEFATLTELGEAHEEKSKDRGVESRNLKAFLGGVAVIGVTTYCGYKLVSGVVGLVLNLL